MKSNPFGMRVPSKKKLPTRTVVKKHLKEWNKDDEDFDFKQILKDIKEDEEKILALSKRMEAFEEKQKK